MLETVLMNLRSTRNVGDLACSPAAYFDFGQAQTLDIQQEAPACKRVILGGGQIYRQVVDAVIYRTAQAQTRVVWGVGISARNAADLTFDILKASCGPISSRNWNVPGCVYVPCASAMSPLFDDVAEPRHEVVIFAHARKSEGMMQPPGIPCRTNHGGTLAETLDFLASGAIVVTNSYHGTYWAMCLGRKVLCLPFSDKFRQFRDNPVFSDPADWFADLNRAEARPDLLEDARARNRAFYDVVLDL